MCRAAPSAWSASVQARNGSCSNPVIALITPPPARWRCMWQFRWRADGPQGGGRSCQTGSVAARPVAWLGTSPVPAVGAAADSACSASGGGTVGQIVQHHVEEIREGSQDAGPRARCLAARTASTCWVHRRDHGLRVGPSTDWEASGWRRRGFERWAGLRDGWKSRWGGRTGAVGPQKPHASAWHHLIIHQK
jgi:hypothetical protein